MALMAEDFSHVLNRWIFEMTYIEIPLNLDIVMFGLLHPYDANLIKNKIILLQTLYLLYKTHI
jgi:predicted AlkP superfamily phosphohydrolase/phosphomutase